MNNQKEELTKQVIEQITVDKLDAIISDKRYKIIDVRDSKSIEKQGSIPDAINIPFHSVVNSIDKFHSDYNDVFDSEGPFLFCCTGGVMSYMAAIKTQDKGIKNVYNLEGGHSAWMQLQKG